MTYISRNIYLHISGIDFPKMSLFDKIDKNHVIQFEKELISVIYKNPKTLFDKIDEIWVI